MKVLIVVPSFLNGGTITSLKNLLTRIDRNKCAVDVFPITNSGPNYDAISHLANVIGTNMDSDNTWNRTLKHFVRSYIFRGVKAVKKFLCKLGYDPSLTLFRRIVPSLQKRGYYEVIAFQEGQATRFVSLFTGVRKIAWVRCDYSKIEQSFQKQDKKQHVYDRIDQIICVSEFTKQQFVKIFPEVGGKTVAIHNFIPSDRIISKAEEIIEDESFEHCSTLRFVSIGRLHSVKRFSEIPKIARYLYDKGLNFRWFVLGGDGGDRVNIEKNIKKYDAEKLVVLLGNRNNPYPYIRKADLLVCTSLSEACPNVINEAKILGTPIICTDFGSSREMMTDGVEGFISSISEVGDRIFHLMTNKDAYSEIKKNINGYSYNNNEIVAKLERVTSLNIIHTL